MSEPLVLVTKEQNIGTITINRPEKRNALNANALRDLEEAIRSVSADGETRVLILRGAGEQAFSSGFDLVDLPGARVRTGDPGAGVSAAIEESPCPVIAMVYGYCLAGGLGLAVSCDMRLAADSARFGMPPARLGLVYPASSMLNFLNLIGVAATKELFYTGKQVTAGKARELGLVNDVVPAEQLAAATYDLAREIALNAPLSIRGAKTTISRLMTCRVLTPQLREELLALQRQALHSEDFQEGRKAFLERRRPLFSGR